METQTFNPFPELPIEIREMIWVAAIHPRLVHIQPGRYPTSQLHPPPAKSPLPPDYLHSNSPIPAPLHTCRESRRVLERNGYCLAFGVFHNGVMQAKPRVWINFGHDALYMRLLWNYEHDRPADCHLNYCCSKERQRVKHIALCTAFHDSKEDIFQKSMKVLHKFEKLENLLLVEQQYTLSSTYRLTTGYIDMKESRQDPLGYLECDTPDGLGFGFAIETVLHSKHFSEIMQYMENTKAWGRGFFQDQALELQERIKKEQNWYSGPFITVHNNVVVNVEPKRFRVPLRVRFVSIVNHRLAQRMLKHREEYWERVQAVEDREAEFGPRRLLGYESDELEYFDEIHTECDDFPLTFQPKY